MCEKKLTGYDEISEMKLQHSFKFLINICVIVPTSSFSSYLECSVFLFFLIIILLAF